MDVVTRTRERMHRQEWIVARQTPFPQRRFHFLHNRLGPRLVLSGHDDAQPTLSSGGSDSVGMIDVPRPDVARQLHKVLLREVLQDLPNGI